MSFRRPFYWLILCVVISFILLAYPIYVIRPFRYQGARELAVALAVTRFRFLIDIALIACSVTALVFAWRRARSAWARVAACSLTLLVIAVGVLSRLNIYELMFHPIDRPEFSPSAKSKLNDNEEVLAVRVREQARAYPVRSISYHHIVNDVLGGLPIVATY